jgi:UDP-N-acetyl-D-glucosamine/UDP-N-acetyl-D-galactosamine dehydrogenase
MSHVQDARIAVIGLGYVGLPLAVEFGKQYETVGYDINDARIDELEQGRDSTLEVEPDELKAATRLRYARTVEDIAGCNVYIVTVPTPIDSAKRPDLRPLEKASEAIGSVLKPGDTVIYESTVYPGCTEEICVPILERASGLSFATGEGHPTPAFAQFPPPPAGEGRGGGASEAQESPAPTFFVGYSPERINPGDKQHRLPDIKKVTSGSTPEAADAIDTLYQSIITAGTHKAPTLKVAEAAKVIENTQRDLNIALVNDLAILFNKLGIDTLDVLEAAGTKWNFLPFRPGLVGGHCIGVDPYYLTHKAQEVGHHPDVILAGRRTNDGMGAYVAEQVIKLMVRKGINPVQARVLILGLAFKENCPDLRNTRVVDIIHALQSYNTQVDVHDPWVDVTEARQEYGITPTGPPEQGNYDAVIVAVGHDQFRELGGQGVRAFGKTGFCVVYDVKYVIPHEAADGRL